MTRPLLFLDVDGVLNPFDDTICPCGFTEHDLFPGEELVRINPTHGMWITELSAVFDLIWATSWNDDANRLLAPLLRIPVLPVLTMPPPPFDPSAKVPLIAAHAQRRPTAWIDDAHTIEARDWAEKRNAPTLLITTDPAIGLTRESVDHLLTWRQTHL
ncbi:HAD domain-containing protein [Micromonospora sp. NBC_01813]|uniref:HAD domain-containing protein n=1 Tax=Micromonospora sp. NBC_01813 TaxID=2975988 RepID=UPI002DD7A29B|nr:HAD domain-containing protein [Micromonospora sp. NBC_01813]WSA07358.1 HAD domain-containing protein [Micromonospora sp. NBC_01813]